MRRRAEKGFVVEKPNGTEYYQVAATVRNASTLERELAPFGKLRDHHPKFLLTLDEDPSDNINGICKLNVLDWLLQPFRPGSRLTL